MAFVLSKEARLDGDSLRRLEDVSGLAWFARGPLEVVTVVDGTIGQKKTARLWLRLENGTSAELPKMSTGSLDHEQIATLDYRPGDKAFLILGVKPIEDPGAARLENACVAVFVKHIGPNENRWACVYQGTDIPSELGVTHFRTFVNALIAFALAPRSNADLDAFMSRADLAPIFAQIKEKRLERAREHAKSVDAVRAHQDAIQAHRNAGNLRKMLAFFAIVAAPFSLAGMSRDAGSAAFVSLSFLAGTIGCGYLMNKFDETDTAVSSLARAILGIVLFCYLLMTVLAFPTG